MASVAATVGLQDRFAYSMTKGAVVSMTLSVARDYLGDKIRCNCISPARIHTPFVDGFLKTELRGARRRDVSEAVAGAADRPYGATGRGRLARALSVL